MPTVWNDVLAYLDAHPEADVSSLRLILCGGSAVPVSLQKPLQERHNLEIRQAWGMTETSPVATAAGVPLGVEGDDVWRYRGGQGRLLCGVEGRIVADDGGVLARDGVAVATRAFRMDRADWDARPEWMRPDVQLQGVDAVRALLDLG